MKTLGKLKLNQFSKEELDQRKMNALKGGCQCTYGGTSCDCGDVGYGIWGELDWTFTSANAAADKASLSNY